MYSVATRVILFFISRRYRDLERDDARLVVLTDDVAHALALQQPRVAPSCRGGDRGGGGRIAGGRVVVGVAGVGVGFPASATVVAAEREREAHLYRERE